MPANSNQECSHMQCCLAAILTVLTAAGTTSCAPMSDHPTARAVSARVPCCGSRDGLQLCIAGTTRTESGSLGVDLALNWIGANSSWVVNEVDRVIVTFLASDGSEVESVTRMIGFPSDFLSRKRNQFTFHVEIDVPPAAHSARASFGSILTPAVSLAK